MTQPQYSSPPLVFSANSFSEIRSRSVVKSDTLRIQPCWADKSLLPYSNSATCTSGISPSCRAWLNSLTIFHNWLLAWLMRPSMLLLVSSRMATCTSGFLVVNRGSALAPAVARSDTAAANVNIFQKLAFIFYLLLSFCLQRVTIHWTGCLQECSRNFETGHHRPRPTFSGHPVFTVFWKWLYQ